MSRAAPTMPQMPERPTIEWTRWWAPFDKPVDVQQSGGFLSDPDDGDFRFGAKDLFAAAELTDRHCLILCGEPGMGKTTELDHLERRLRTADETIIRVNFRSCLDAADFKAKTFRAKAWKTWLRSEGRLRLLIDGVDEGLWLIPNFLEWFIDALRTGIPLERLSVVLACRSWEWPQDLGRELAGLWNEPTTERTSSVFQLCPLTRGAVLKAAEAHGVSASDFFAAVYERQVQPLAARPLTLFMLLDEFRDKGSDFGRTHRELYFDFCSRLCRDANAERVSRLRRRGVKWTDYRPSQLQAVAGRIAAMMLIGAKSSVLRNGTPTSTDLLVEEIEASVESDSMGEFEVTEDLIEATLATRLFSPKRTARFGFEHQTFAECLAAQYLATVGLGTLRTILCRSDAAGEYVVPQLAELAAWLGGERDDVFDLLLRIQPEILLRTDLAHVANKRKFAVVAALLKKATSGEYFEGIQRRPFYEALAHPGLAHQLRPPLLDRKSNNAVRWLALDIAAACKCRELFPALLTILKRKNDPVSRQAGYALDDLVDEKTAARLIQIVEGTFNPELPRAVRASALRGLVATIWSVGKALPWAKQLASTVDYLDWYLADRLKPGDVSAALRTVSDCKRVFDSLFRLRKVVARSLRFFLDEPEDPQTVGLVAEMLFREIETYGLQDWNDAGEFGKQIKSNATIRRKLLLEVNRVARKSKPEHSWLLAQLLLPEDLPWLMDCAAASAPTERSEYLEMIGWMMRPDVVAPYWDEVISRIKATPALRSLKPWFVPWGLRSRIAVKARSAWKQRSAKLELHKRRLERNKLPTREPLIDRALSAGAAGNTNAWVDLSVYAFITDSRDWSSGQPYYDITASPGWLFADEQRRGEMRKLARNFLLGLKQEVPRRPNQSDNLSDATFAASWLLRDELATPGLLQDAFAKHCVPSILWAFGEEDAILELTTLIYPLSRARCREKFLEKIKFDAENGDGLTLAVRPFLGCWDAELGKIAERFLLQKPRRSETIRTLLAEIARIDASTVQRVWRASAKTHATSDKTDAAAMAAATELIIELFAEQLWDELYAFLVLHPEVTRISVLRSAHYGHGYGLKPPFPLSEVHLRQLYLLLYKIFPPSDPGERWPDDGEPHRLGSRHAAARFRDSLRDQLVARGTTTACQELKLICSKVAKDDRLWAKKRWLDCVELVRQKAWRPLGISEVAEIARRRTAYWVQSEDDLLVAVQESLDELQQSLRQSPTGDAIAFWDFKRTGTRISDHKPKSEVDIARIIYSWLHQKLGGAHGAIVHREVAVQWDQRRTDIEVVVAAENRRNWREVSVVIEVKRAWNPGVKIDARGQLRGRYLERTARRHGIYLVAWFECDVWTPRIRKLKARSVAAAKKEVASICKKASTNGFVIAPFVLDCGLPA